MQIDMNKKAAATPNPQQRGRVVVSMNPVRERVRLDIDGNEIDPRTKRIIRKAEDIK